MDDRESSTNVDDLFLDASDEFPFYDCIGTTASGSISEPEAESSVPAIPESSPEMSASEGLRRREPFIKDTAEVKSLSESIDSKANSSVSFENIDVKTGSISATSSTTNKDDKYGFSEESMENERRRKILEAFKVRLSSGSTDNQLKEEVKENSTVTSAEDAKIEHSATLESQSGFVDDSAFAKLLLFFAGLLIKAINYQIYLLVSFMTFPIWSTYHSCVFISNPSRSVRRIRGALKQTLLRIWNTVYQNLTPYEWLKEQKSMWMLALHVGLGLLWSVYVCFVLVSLLVFAFLVSSYLMRSFVSEPIQMNESLNFDYTENSPVAFVPIMSCSGAEKGEIVKLSRKRIIPYNHKLKVTVSMTLPESVYNRNLGNFQVKVDLLSINGTILQTLRRPCILNFKSEPIQIILTFLKIAPLITGYSLESQTLNIPFIGLTEKDIPSSCLKVTVEQRAEFRPGSGIPEIYAASLALESKLPLLKTIMWNWKTTIYIWFSMTMFCMELFFALLCCKPIIIPQARSRGASSIINASRDSAQIRR